MSESTTAEPELIDLLHLGRPEVIGAWRVGEVIVDPGPSSCLDRLLPMLEPDPPRVLALTHIHLDHAGASGSLVQRFPEAEIWVHERGAHTQSNDGCVRWVRSRSSNGLSASLF